MTMPKTSDVVVVEDPSELARTLTESFCVAANGAITARGVFNVALAGGSTPKAAYALLANPPYRSLVEWKHVRFFFGDERCVPPDHPDSNYRTACETLFAPLDIPDTNVFRMRGEDEPGAAAAAYAQTLTRELGTTPVFDLVLLGMGADGHTASLFPGAPPDDGTTALVQVRTAPATMPITNRLTLTPRVINAARKVVVAVTGASKAEKLAQALNGAYDPTTCPVQIVRPASGRCTWLTDEAAATMLML
jgi:6-phosphogluconolactonase